MKLSEAMRAGAKKRPQCYGSYYELDTVTNIVESCALGAAFEAIGVFNPDELVKQMPMTLLDPIHDAFDGFKDWTTSLPDVECGMCHMRKREPYQIQDSFVD